MIRSGNKIRLTAAEKERLSFYAQEPVNPGTVADHDAWIEHSAQKIWTDDTPEERLIRAILNAERIAR